jgi:hypothetical protein
MKRKNIREKSPQILDVKELTGKSLKTKVEALLAASEPPAEILGEAEGACHAGWRAHFSSRLAGLRL